MDKRAMCQLASNPEKRFLVSVVFDHKGQEQGGAMTEEQRVLQQWTDKLAQDPFLATCVEMYVSCVGQVASCQPTFVPLDALEPPRIYARVDRDMLFEGLLSAYKTLRLRCSFLRRYGLGYYTPLVVLLSDNLSSYRWDLVRAEVEDIVQCPDLSAVAVGVRQPGIRTLDGADRDDVSSNVLNALIQA